MSRRLPPHIVRASQCLRTPTDICLQHAARLSNPARLFRPNPVNQNYAYTTHRSISATGSKAFSSKLAAGCAISTLLATFYYSTTHPQLNDSPSNTPTSLLNLTSTNVDSEETEKVPTGTSTVPFFPKSIWLPRAGNNSGKSAALPAGTGAADDEEEYHLLGLGIRKVSFLRIQVYVVGIYVALSDKSKLQEAMVHSIASGSASTLVEGEKEELRKVLLDGEGSAKIWAAVLRDGGLKSAVRIVPVRNTDFGHLRDGWVRGIDARGKGREFEDEGFTTAIGEFKGLFGGRKSVGKGRELLLRRGEDGGLGVWVEEETEGKKGEMVRLGGVRDERVARLVWLAYLAGSNVASEDARRSVVDGVMEIVERPIGTVETQVV